MENSLTHTLGLLPTRGKGRIRVAKYNPGTSALIEGPETCVPREDRCGNGPIFTHHRDFSSAWGLYEGFGNICEGAEVER